MEYIVDFSTVGMGDVARVGGKNASIGEMIANLSAAGVRVPGGFATTADAYRAFLAQDGLGDRIRELLADVDGDDVVKLAERGKRVRELLLAAPLPERLRAELRDAYAAMCAEAGGEVAVAVRSSATAEDLPEASFAGQQETYLNVCGLEAVEDAVRKVFASLFTDRAISYRLHHGFAHEEVALSAGVQRMARSDLGSSGVAFTLDTESGFDGAVFVTSTYGLGELLVQGAVNPDEFYLAKKGLREGRPAVLARKLGTKAEKMVYAPGGGVERVPVAAADRARFSLDDDDLHELGRQCVAIEDHYGRPMDIEWVKDGEDGLIYIVQARPETVQSRSGRVLTRYRMKGGGEPLVVGRAVGSKVATGVVRVIARAAEMERVQPGDVLVTDMTDPDWEPVMKRAAAIVTNRGGRTCHAAIVARELGIPAVVGTGDATEALTDGDVVTVSCAEGDEGKVYAGALEYDVQDIELDAMPELPVKVMMNVASPERAFAFAAIPNHGVGLARLEFIINNAVGVHPNALMAWPDVPEDVKAEIKVRSAGYESPRAFYEEKLKEGIATIAAAFYPKPVIVRLSDFKSNEYAHLLGGHAYEPREENPMIGFRGASRYRSEVFAEPFAAECRALKRVREEMGFTNVEVMIPFVRTVPELLQVLEVMASHGLRRGEAGLRVIMMCEVPSNAVLADAFLEHVDGFSIGSNDLTQFTLALDRDSGLVADLFDERDPAVKHLASLAIAACRRAGKYIGICGQGPSDHPDYAQWLVEEGIDSIGLNPDTVLETWLFLAGEKEAA
ncbi:MAG TPA: phosphoenolpyruvate synthase [Trueperaceae bacterium]|nr:phosphoenolpyruvate synthase [Trueperaceae bacterium]